MPPRIDFHSRYTRVPSKPQPAFPDILELWAPVVEVAIRAGRKSFRAFGLLDTGSQWTIVGTKYADALGIDWKSAPQMSFTGIGNPDNVGHAIDVKLVLVAANFAWDARILVSEAADPFPMILLGHIGFFEEFEATFKTRQRYFHLGRK